MDPETVRWLESAPSAAAAETLLEEFLELGVEDGVDDGVEGAVDVAQPGDGAHQTGRDVARQTHGPCGVDHEERGPAEEEAACSNTEKPQGGVKKGTRLRTPCNTQGAVMEQQSHDQRSERVRVNRWFVTMQLV